MPRGYPGSTPGVDPRSQGVIPRRFKRKKNFVTVVCTKDGRTDRRDGGNSDVDFIKYTFSKDYKVIIVLHIFQIFDKNGP